MSDILLRMGNHHTPNNFMRISVRERTPATREDAFALAKAWEESQVKDCYVFNNYDYDLYKRHITIKNIITNCIVNR